MKLPGSLFAATILSAWVSASPAHAAPRAQEPLAPIPSIDLPGYMGRWYQIAAVPQIFNLQCAYDTTATYALVDERTVSVENRCRTWWDKLSGVDGTAEVVDPNQPAALAVNFSNLPFPRPKREEPNYIITYLDPSGDWALVGNPNRSSGFVLSRSPAVSSDRWRDIKSVIADRGYWDCAFLTSPTREGLHQITPLCVFDPE